MKITGFSKTSLAELRVDWVNVSYSCKYNTTVQKLLKMEEVITQGQNTLRSSKNKQLGLSFF